MSEPERVFEPHWHDLTDEERKKLGADLAGRCKALGDLVEEKATSLADFNARIKAERLEVAALAHKLTTGGEMRDVEVMIMMDAPEPGTKSVLELASNKVLRTEPMTARERADQSSFGFEEPKE